MFSRIVLALALLASSTTAFQANFPKLGGAKASKKIEVPEEEKPLTERLGGVGVTAPFNEGFDPFGFASRADAAQMIKFREVSSARRPPALSVLVPPIAHVLLLAYVALRRLPRAPSFAPSPTRALTRRIPAVCPPLRLCAGGA